MDSSIYQPLHLNSLPGIWKPSIYGHDIIINKETFSNRHVSMQGLQIKRKGVWTDARVSLSLIPSEKISLQRFTLFGSPQEVEEGLRVFMKNNTTLRGKYHPSTKPPVFYIDMKCDSDPKFTKNYQMFLCLVLSDLAFKRRLLGQNVHLATDLYIMMIWWERGGGVSSNIYLVHFVVIYFVSNLLLFEYWRQNIVNYDGPFAAQLNLYNL